MNTEKKIFETGATSAAVNELILYTDSTRELTEKRDQVYGLLLMGEISPYNMFWQFRYDLLPKSQMDFLNEVDANNDDVLNMSETEKKEYCQIYANRFPEWKKEKERNL